MTPKNESKRGGARPGAGRPKSEHKKRQISVHISEEVVDKLDSVAREVRLTRSAVIEALFVYAFDNAGYEAVMGSSVPKMGSSVPISGDQFD